MVSSVVSPSEDQPRGGRRFRPAFLRPHVALVALAPLLVAAAAELAARGVGAESRTGPGVAVWLFAAVTGMLCGWSSLGRRARAPRASRDRRARAAYSVVSQEVMTGVVHETRTTLNAIIGLVRILGRTGVDADQSRHVQMVREAAESLLVMLDSTFDLARMEAGTLELDERVFDLDDLLDEVLQIAHPRAHAKGVELSAAVAVDVPRTLRGDFGRLRRMLLLLVSNGIRFSTEGEGCRLRVREEA